MGRELVALGGAFLAAGLLARLGRRYGLPTIPFFMAAGVLCGPNTPGIVLIEEPHDLELLAVLGLILLLFHLGLEFSVDDLVGGGRKLLLSGGIYLFLNVGGGLVLGTLIGWGSSEAWVIAGAVGISSSAIVTKLLGELHRFSNQESPVILGIIVVEDIFLALFLALLQPVFGNVEPGMATLLAVGKALLFLTVLFVVARRGGKWVGKLIGSDDNELLTVLFLGLAVLVAGLAEVIGVSEAIGAFIAGMMVGATTLHRRVERLVLPLRDAFAAVFFFAFGLTIDPGAVGPLLGLVAVAVLMTTILNVAAGLIVARIYGFDRRAASAVGFTVLGRGEFSLILVTLGVNAGLDPRLSPFIAAYVLVLAIAAPILAARSDDLARFLPQRALAR